MRSTRSNVEVIGIFQSFSRDFDARAVRIPLAAAQELLATTGANQLVVTLHRTQDTDAALATIQAQLAGSGLEAYSWKQLSDFYEKTLQLYDRQFGVLQVIILVMVLLSVANTVNMSAFERLGEFGTLQALGNRQRDIFRLILLENTFLGLIGGTLGAIIGIGLALADLRDRDSDAAAPERQHRIHRNDPPRRRERGHGFPDRRPRDRAGRDLPGPAGFQDGAGRSAASANLNIEKAHHHAAHRPPQPR